MLEPHEVVGGGSGGGDTVGLGGGEHLDISGCHCTTADTVTSGHSGALGLTERSDGELRTVTRSGPGG